MENLQSKIGLLTDEEIIQKINGGETALFEVLIRRYNPLLYKIARSYGLNHQDAEDMMQESHFTAYKNLENFRHESSYKTWLTKIHLHKCYHKIHYGYRKYEQVNDALIREDMELMHNAPEQNSEKTIINKELTKVLETCVQELPFMYRSVFVLREIEGFTVAETAQLLAITETNVKVRLNRAKALLQKKLEKIYSITELFEFHLKFCDTIVKRVFDRIEQVE